VQAPIDRGDPVEYLLRQVRRPKFTALDLLA
jgi:hypothetical protein